MLSLEMEGNMVARVQRGHIYSVKNASGKIASFHVRYRVLEEREGKLVRVLKSHKLVDRDEKYFSATCKAVADLADTFLRQTMPTDNHKDMAVIDFWEQIYLPF